MSDKQDREGNFEERLLTRMKAVVAERGAAEARDEAPTKAPRTWRYAPRVALGATAALVAFVAVMLVNAGGENTSQAFAVEPQEGGGVTIRVYSLSDASGLERALEEAGIRSQVTWLPAGMTCRKPHYRPSSVKLPGGGTIGEIVMGGPEALTFGIGSTERWRERSEQYRRGEISEEEYRSSSASLNLDPAAFRPDQTVVLSGAPAPYDGDPEGGYEARVAIAAGEVDPCEPVPGRVSSR